jgi:hypothetical protein
MRRRFAPLPERRHFVERTLFTVIFFQWTFFQSKLREYGH